MEIKWEIIKLLEQSQKRISDKNYWEEDPLEMKTQAEQLKLIEQLICIFTQAD